MAQSLEVSSSCGPSVATKENEVSLLPSSLSHCLGWSGHWTSEPQVKWHLAGTVSVVGGEVAPAREKAVSWGHCCLLRGLWPRDLLFLWSFLGGCGERALLINQPAPQDRRHLPVSQPLPVLPGTKAAECVDLTLKTSVFRVAGTRF